MIAILTLLLTILGLCVLAIPSNTYVLHEKRDIDFTTWTRRREAQADVLIPVSIGMTQSNLDKGHDWLIEISSHDSHNYAKHYTPLEIIELFAPHNETISIVRNWLETFGIVGLTVSTNKQWMQFIARLETVEALLKTKFYEYEHTMTGDISIACDGYHVPAHVQAHIDYITPGTKMIKIRKRAPSLKERAAIKEPPGQAVSPSVLAAAASGDLAECALFITQSCIMAMYNITASTSAYPGNSLGIFEGASNWYDQPSLDLYWKTLATNVKPGTHPDCKGINGGFCKADNIDSTSGVPGDIALQAAMPLVYPQNIVMFGTDDIRYQLDFYYGARSPGGLYDNFFDAIDGSFCHYAAFNQTENSPGDPSYPDNRTLGYNHTLQCGVYKPTNVVVLTYPLLEAEPDFPIAYQKRQCNEIMKLGLQGITVVVPAGFRGVGTGFPFNDYSSTSCGGPISSPIFAPSFPATCPYVTTVGMTTLPVGANASKDREIVDPSTGGGFSNIFLQPSYQEKAVSNFFSKHSPNFTWYETTDNQSVGVNGGQYNRIGRGFPDVATVGANFLGILDGFAYTFDAGSTTSVAIFGAVLNRINEARLFANKSTIGFVNPVLYAHPDVFHDIISGSNPACGSGGFSAAPGWDPVSGLGTPKFYEMMELFLRLP